MSEAWFCPGCNKYHAPHVETCPNDEGTRHGKEAPPITVLPDYSQQFIQPVRAAKVVSKPRTCFECGKPVGECDPEGLGHYRG